VQQSRRTRRRQYQKLFDEENALCSSPKGALRTIAPEALKCKSGAHGLCAIIESVMVD
jgi:ATP-dependent protease Clp ATPase subunit